MGQFVAKLAVLSALFLVGLAASGASVQKAALQLWYWHHSQLGTAEGVATSKALIDRAARAGYTGVAFWDGSFARLSDPSFPREDARRLQEVMQYAAGKGMRVLGSGAPFGWSNGALIPDGNLAEGQRIIRATFTVDRLQGQLNFVNSLAPLHNGSFEEGRSDWFDTGDAATGISGEAHSGKQSAVIVDNPGNARFRQKITLTPWRQYHLTLWFKSKNFRGPAAVEVLDWWHRGVNRFYTEIAAGGTHEWTKVDFTFNSQETRWAYLYFGIWGRSSGVLWFDDVTLEETAPVYVIRRPGAPLRLYDPKDTNTVYREGRDFSYISDPVLSPPHAVFRDVYHAPVRVTLPPTTHLHHGQTVALDYYAVFPIPQDQQVAMCLTEPGVFRWVKQNALAVQVVMPKNAGILLVYDELRQANSCAACRAMHMDAGDLLAWNVKKTVDLYHAIAPGTLLYVWSDMFDPTHNAHDHYFYVEGNLAGSWRGLAGSVGVLNWNHGHLRESLEWFSGVNGQQPIAHKQVIASYYDSGDAMSAAKDLQIARGVPGVDGIMYVTWRDDYSQLENFARSATQAWGSYQTSVANQAAK